MYVNAETKRPAWLISQDQDGVTYSDGERRHSCAAHEFFGAHREATAAELREHGGETHGETARSMAARAAKPKADKPKAAAKPAAKPARAPRTAAKAKGKGKAPEPAKAPPAPPQGLQEAVSLPMQQTPPGDAPKASVRVEPLK